MKTKAESNVGTTVPNKTRALLQQEISSVCPFCNNGDVDHFQVHHIDGNKENDDTQNLIMLCPLCHSKITKGDIKYDGVINKKNNLKNNARGDKSMGKIINFNGNVDNAVIGNNNTINIVEKKTAKSKYPEGCIGFDNIKANYIGCLISRYNKYKEYEVGKENMRYGVVTAQLKKKFKIGTTRTIYNLQLDKFEELVDTLKKIDGTMLAKIKKGKGQLKNYDAFEEYIASNN
jgi:hypothetical protein